MRFIWKKILRLALIALATTVITFLMVEILPGDVAYIIGGQSATQEDIQAIRDLHFKLFQQSHQQHNGTLLRYYGDGTMSVFDHPDSAVRCAMQLQNAFQQEGIPFGFRAGIACPLTSDRDDGRAVLCAGRVLCPDHHADLYVRRSAFAGWPGTERAEFV